MGSLPCIENLEKRKLFSISWVNHVINVQGAANSSNMITVGLNPGGTSVFATVSYPSKKGTVTQTKSYALSMDVRFMKIVGGNTSDLITVDQTNGSFPLITHIVTRVGNDTVMGGDEPDQIVCGNGIDLVNSGNGNDTLKAGHGPDTLTAGDGNDHLQSGPNHDLLVAGNGNNTFTDPFGHVTLQGGTGHDTYILKNVRLDTIDDYSPTNDTLKTWVPPAKSDNLGNDILNGILDYGSFL